MLSEVLGMYVRPVSFLLVPYLPCTGPVLKLVA